MYENFQFNFSSIYSFENFCQNLCDTCANKLGKEKERDWQRFMNIMIRIDEWSLVCSISKVQKWSIYENPQDTCILNIRVYNAVYIWWPLIDWLIWWDLHILPYMNEVLLKFGHFCESIFVKRFYRNTLMVILIWMYIVYGVYA